MKNIPLTSVISRLEGDKEFALEKTTQFAGNYTLNPIFALEWVDAQFDYAATLESALRLLDTIEYGQREGRSDEEILAEVIREVKMQLLFRASSATNKSTGQGTNLMNDARVQVWAKYYEWLTGR